MLVVTDASMHNPDMTLFQNIQLVLDQRASPLLQSFLGARSNLSIMECILKVNTRALCLCCSLPMASQTQEPFLSLGLEFSRCEWVQGIADSLRDVKRIPMNSECFQLGMKCLFLMSTNLAWMRAWPMCDILPFLLMVKKRLTKFNNLESIYMKKLITQTLRQISINKHSYMSAAVSMRVLSGGLEASLLQKNSRGETLLDSTTPQPIQALLLEAQDMSFGSTLTEQRVFTTELLKWLHVTFPVASPISRGKKLTPVVNSAHLDSFWIATTELLTILTQWMPTMLLPLEVEDSSDTDRKQRAKESAGVILDQIQVIERVMVYALRANGEGLRSVVLGALWCGPSGEQIEEDGEVAEERYEPVVGGTVRSGAGAGAGIGRREAGLLYIIRHLDLTVILSDHFLCTKVYMHIVVVLIRLLNTCTREEVELVANLGTVSACLQFLYHGVQVMRSVVPRSALHTAFKQLYPSLVSTMRGVWTSCLQSESAAVYEAILASDVIRVMTEEWLPDTSNLGLKSAHGAIDSIDFQPLMIRFEAALMLRALTFQPVEKLIYELSCRVASAGTVEKELLKMKSTSTKQGASLSRSSAVSVLSTLAQLNIELVNIDLQVKG